jgi:hypothetical protein
MLYECDALATFGYFSLGSGKLDPELLGKVTQNQSWPLVRLQDLDKFLSYTGMLEN